MIIIESKRKKQENILKKYPNAILADVTSKAEGVMFQFFVNRPIIMPSVVAEEYEHAASHAMGFVPFRDYVGFKHIVFLAPICQKHCKAD